MELEIDQPDSLEQRLARAAEQSYRSLLPFRDFNRELIRSYVGPNYGDQQSKSDEKYLNLLNQAVEAYQMLLAANRPRVMISTPHPELKPFATQFTAAMNALIKEIGLEHTIRQWVMDAFFCVGIVKTHVADSGLVELEPDLWMDPGQPFASNVNLDDFVFDMSAKKFSEVKFAGDMYRLPFADLKSDFFNQDVVKDLQPNSKYQNVADRVDRISKGYETDNDELEPSIDLCDLWVPREGKVYTFAVSNRDQFKIKDYRPVAVVEWTGTEHGPYHLLSFSSVPNNIMPVSLASQLEALDRLVNNLMRKHARQARRQKTIHLYTAGGADTSKNIQRASDGDWVKCNDPREIGTVTHGGVDANNHKFAMGAVELFDRQAGNLTAMMGLGAQTATVGQEQLVHGAASRKESQMQYRVMEATTRLIAALGQMLWEDPFKEMALEIPILGAEGMTVTGSWKPGERMGNFIDYNFDIDVFSMQYQSPDSKVKTINDILTSVFIPMAQLLMQQGGTIDLFALAKFYADKLNMPEINDVLKFAMSPEGEQDSSGPPITRIPKNPNSTRNYVRTSVSASAAKPTYGAGDMQASGASDSMSMAGGM